LVSYFFFNRMLVSLFSTLSLHDALPIFTIQDKPRFPWRGLMIDSARHFIPLDVIRRNLDGMEAVKMNVFHWHLSENQGFRVESRSEEHTSELQSRVDLVCRLLLDKKKTV